VGDWKAEIAAEVHMAIVKIVIFDVSERGECQFVALAAGLGRSQATKNPPPGGSCRDPTAIIRGRSH
jgi:hypothetical protein